MAMKIERRDFLRVAGTSAAGLLLARPRSYAAPLAAGMLLAAKRHQLKVELLDLRNSGDTAGDRSRVVGYAAFAFSGDARERH